MAAESLELITLSCAAQNYAWGKPASTSKVAQLLGKSNDGDNPYAELWMGTHKKGPAYVDKQLLSEYLGKELPYLYKVLSVARSLSIQAHPNKALAQKLNSERPEVYKDDNHKPEMAIALTLFEAMCGFRPSSQIAFFLTNVCEFKEIVGKDIAQSFIDNKDDPKQLKAVFTSVMTADKDKVTKQVNTLIQRLEKEKIPPFEKDEDNKEKDKEEKADDKEKDKDFVRNIDINELVIRLNKQYPGDVGIFAAFMLNCFRLKPGEAVFLEANLPHAYLDGDCLECMACSDNVVRAGLTPKLRDTPVLCEMLNYNASNPKIMTGIKIGEYSKQYRAGDNINEFRLDRIDINDGKKGTKECLEINKIDGCKSDCSSIILVYDGVGNINGKDIKQGDILLLNSKVDKLDIENTSDKPLKLARCYAPSN